MSVFQIIGALGLISISVGLPTKNKIRQAVLYLLGGILLEIYSIFINDILFIVLQGIFVLDAIYNLYKQLKLYKNKRQV